MEANAEAQWVHIIIKSQNRFSRVQVKNANLKWGKFTDKNNNEISASQVNEVYADEYHDGNIFSSGRANASSGTEGSFDLVYSSGRVCTVYWECPWGSKTNTFEIDGVKESWIVHERGAHINGGALGNVEINIFRSLRLEEKESAE